jgi:hypothetical protein
MGTGSYKQWFDRKSNDSPYVYSLPDNRFMCMATNDHRLFSRLRNLNSDKVEWVEGIASTSREGDHRCSAAVSNLLRNPTALFTRTDSQVRVYIEALNQGHGADKSFASVQAEAQNTLYSAIHAHGAWMNGRTSSCSRRAQASLQNVLDHLALILENISGIATIVKAADQQYGGMVIGTIALLATVAANKERRETVFERALKEIAYILPRCDVLMAIEPVENLKALMVQVFELTIDFCRDATEYFAKHHRLRETFFPKPQTNKILEELRITVAVMRDECDFYMLKELTAIKNQLVKLNETALNMHDGVWKTQALVTQLDSTSREDLLSHLRRLLGLKPSLVSTSEAVASYRSMVQHAFPKRSTHRKHPRQLSQSLLELEPAYVEWRSHTTSSTLLLGGSSWPGSSMGHSWLSMASTIVLENPNIPRPLFVFCHPEYAGLPFINQHFSSVFHQLIYQLCEQHQDHLRHEHLDIEDLVQAKVWEASDRVTALNKMAKLLVSLLCSFKDRTEFTIVIDRLDKCTLNSPSDRVHVNRIAMHDSVATIQNAIHDPRLRNLCIKVLLVMDELPAVLLADFMRGQKGHFIHKVNWAQEGEDYRLID